MFILATVTLTYLALWPIDVIKNSSWELTVDKSSYHVGDTATVHVVADKLKPYGGKFVRNIECKSGTGSYVSYYIAESDSNRQAGHVETDVPIKIPSVGATLPAQCHFVFVIEYRVYSFRSFTEYNNSNEFELLPAQEPATPTPTTSNDVAVVGLPQAVPASPIKQTPSKENQTNTSQTTPSNTNDNTNNGGQGQDDTPDNHDGLICRLTLHLILCN